ncbi:unnamed protein product [Nesidiocoris tenuis]|uniref:Phorbol-ester/DAG-type domain-containing protein n=1 Tax=Nesidiocoris tenuis TaxID=355587 RepID=A0A6H5GZ20_9HEMI|nr:unnamed protein product [Nesidiocoris tenuis]
MNIWQGRLSTKIFPNVPPAPGMPCQGEDRSIYRRGARRWRKLYRVNGHIFQAKRFNRRAFCAFCQDRIWGLGRQGFKCIQCKLLVHKKCHKLVVKPCSNEAVEPIVKDESNGDTPTITSQSCSNEFALGRRKYRRSWRVRSVTPAAGSFAISRYADFTPTCSVCWRSACLAHIRRHPLEQKQVTPPYKPRLDSDRDLFNFPPEFTDEPVHLTPDDPSFEFFKISPILNNSKTTRATKFVFHSLESPQKLLSSRYLQFKESSRITQISKIKIGKF